MVAGEASMLYYILIKTTVFRIIYRKKGENKKVADFIVKDFACGGKRPSEVTYAFGFNTEKSSDTSSKKVVLKSISESAPHILYGIRPVLNLQ